MTGPSRILAALLLVLGGCGESREEPLRLTGKLDGQTLVLHWDPRSPIISRARGGKVTIAGGTRRLERPLTPEELRRGVLIYSPAINDMSVTLEVMAKNGRASKESLQVIDSPEAAAAAEPQAERMKPEAPARPPGFPLPPRGVRD